MTAEALKEALDPILAARGFSAGQGSGGEDADVIWCADGGDFRQRFPWLPQAREQERAGVGFCIDLTVRLGLGRVIGVDLETHSLAETFDALRRKVEAQRARAVIGSTTDASATRLSSLLVELFAVPAPPPATQGLRRG